MDYSADPFFGDVSKHKFAEFNLCKMERIDHKLNEKRITLAYALGNSQLPLFMTVQERYFLMIKYVQNQTNTLFLTNTDFSNCFKKQSGWIHEVSEVGVTVRQLTGSEAEEAHCMNAAEWIACLLEFQIKYENHEHLGQCPDRSAIDQAYKQQFSQKLGYLKRLPRSEFNLIYLDYLKLNSQLFTHIELSVNNDGFVVQRGADDAPIARHRPSAVW